MLESIEKLREPLQKNKIMRYCEVLDSLDEIEREISERYMLLPVDADGVPWGEADKAFYANGENFARRLAGFSYAFEEGRWLLEDGDCCTFYADECRHVKPRMVEDVLCDVWNEALDYANSDMWRNPSEVFAERADEIRELLGGDAE